MSQSVRIAEENAEQNGSTGPLVSGPSDPRTTQPGKALILDSDGDGVPNKVEEEFGINPLDMDSDDDGLSDGDELCPSGLVLKAMIFFHADFYTSPDNPDTDGDGIPDGTEVGVQSPLLGPDGIADAIGVSDDGTFVEPDPCGVLLRPFIFEKWGADIASTPVSGESDYWKSGGVAPGLIPENRVRFRPDADPATITSPATENQNMNGNQDGVDDYVAGRSNCAENYNGKWEPGEKDVTPTLIIEDDRAPNKTSPFPFIYIARHPTENEEKIHKSAWGNQLRYSFVQGAKPIRRIIIMLPASLKVKISPEVISFSKTDPGLRASCQIDCFETEMQSHRITITTTYMDGTSSSVITDIDIGPPMPIPLTRSKRRLCSRPQEGGSAGVSAP